jgi:hypothetical protein
MPAGDHQAMAGRNRIGVADPDGERVLAEDTVGRQRAEWTGGVGQGGSLGVVPVWRGSARAATLSGRRTWVAGVHAGMSLTQVPAFDESVAPGCAWPGAP